VPTEKVGWTLWFSRKSAPETEKVSIGYLSYLFSI